MTRGLWLTSWRKWALAASIGCAVGAAAAIDPLLTLGTVVIALAGGAAYLAPELLVYAGLFLLSSDELFVTRTLTNLAVKPSFVLFALAFLGALALGRRLRLSASGRHAPLYMSFLGLCLVEAVAVAASSQPTLGLRQFLIIGFGAVLPVLSLVMALDNSRKVARAVVMFLGGQFFVALYGIYQFVAGYAGLPQGFEYTGVVGGLGRVSALSYEPAFFAAYLVTGVPLLLLTLRVRRRTISWTLATVVMLALLLANSRAGYLGAAAAFTLGVLVLKTHSKLKAHRIVVPVALAALAFVVSTLALSVNPASFLIDRMASIGDLTDVTSNIPRLVLYDATLRIFLSHPLLGVGPSNLGSYLTPFGNLFPLGELTAVANDIWLQAAVDAGLLGVTFTAAVVASVALYPLKRVEMEARMLKAGVLTFWLVSGAFVSFFWDVKAWALIGLLVAAHETALRASCTPEASHGDRRQPVRALLSVERVRPGD